MDRKGKHKYKGATAINVIPRGAEWIHSGNNYTQIIITLGKNPREWCEGRADREIKQLIVFRDGADDAVVCTDGSVMRCISVGILSDSKG